MLERGEKDVDLSHVQERSLYMPPLQEFLVRQERLERMVGEKDAYIFFSPRAIFYLSGCALSQTERPVVFIHVPGKENILFIPRMELEHAEHTVQGCRVVCYREYPDTVHPMIHLQRLLNNLHLSEGIVAADSDGYSSAWGYRGPALSELCQQMRIQWIPFAVSELRMIKSEYEMLLMRESAKWANFEHALLKEYTKAGKTEIEICQRASSETVGVMLRALGPKYRMSGMDRDGARAVFRGQVGKNSAFPHAVVINATLHRGDNVVTGVNAYIQGYFTEMERVMFVGEPSKEQVKFYELALEAQQIALSVIKPGVTCSTVDAEMYRFYKERGLEKYWRHHSGHSIGQEGHEAPFFDIGDSTILQPGMCMSVEPGIYVEGLGGFRVSDTIYITEKGVECLTYFSKNLEDIICE